MFGVVIPPPGYNLDTTTEDRQGHRGRDSAALVRPCRARKAYPDGPPKIDRFFFVATRASTFLGATSGRSEARGGELKPVLSEPVFKEPGTFGIINQRSLFGRGVGGGREIELEHLRPRSREHPERRPARDRPDRRRGCRRPRATSSAPIPVSSSARPRSGSPRTGSVSPTTASARASWATSDRHVQ